VAFTNDANVLRDALSTPYATGRTALYDAVLVAIHHLQKDDREKKILILISDGGDSASKHTFADVLRLAQTTGVVIYTIGLLDEHNADQNPRSFRNLPLLQAARPTFRTLSSRSSTFAEKLPQTSATNTYSAMSQRTLRDLAIAKSMSV
jgi:hypothetical protein